MREKDGAGTPPVNGGWFAKVPGAEASDAARATMYAGWEDEHTFASTLVQDSYERDLRALIPRPAGRKVSGRDTQMWSGVGFVSSIPVVMGLMEGSELSAVPLVIAASMAAVPAAGIAVRNAFVGLRVKRWERATAVRRAADRPRVDAVKALAYTEARRIQTERWALTEAAVSGLRRDVSA